MTRCADVDTYVYVNIHVYFLFLKQYVQWICLFVTEWVKLFWDIGNKKLMYVEKNTESGWYTVGKWHETVSMIIIISMLLSIIDGTLNTLHSKRDLVVYWLDAI